ncbi:MAG TPA: aminoacetone oxidase family FAD-binding enzyme [Acholeplasmataceae bacterium]|nr:aminoacetone oxidase family FAD-binding enzyme [Acholeplasmataceae bacterium]
MKRNIIIVGGGASGIISALRLKMENPDLKVLLLEQNPRIGKKILKTGNGRCNISNLNMSSDHYNQPQFLSSCLRKFSVNDLVDFFQKLGLILRADSFKRLYPYSEYATTVLEVFLQALNKYQIDVRCNQEVKEIFITDGFVVKTENDIFESDFVIVATGSLAQEKTNGYELLKKLNHTKTALEPGLVPLKTKENLSSLRGIKIKCKARVIHNDKILHEEEGEMLFKEQGLSGVLSLNLSRYAQPESIISLDLFPNTEILPILKELTKDKDLENVLLGIFPKMLVYEILKRSKHQNLFDVAKLIHNLEYEVVGKYSFSNAQITLGGININEINYDFSSKLNKDLFIIGEVLDVDGECGGYNLHFAWVSGIIAADAILKHFEKKL